MQTYEVNLSKCSSYETKEQKNEIFRFHRSIFQTCSMFAVVAKDDGYLSKITAHFPTWATVTLGWCKCNKKWNSFYIALSLSSEKLFYILVNYTDVIHAYLGTNVVIQSKTILVESLLLFANWS